MKKIISYIFLTLTLVLGCAFAVQAAETEHKPADIPGLTFDHSMELSYAKEFNVDYYNDGYALITIDQEGQFLVVPEGKEAPEGLDENVKILQQPLENIYLAATSAMALFDAIDGLGSIRFSGTQANGWYIDNAVQAMENGDIIYLTDTNNKTLEYKVYANYVVEPDDLKCTSQLTNGGTELTLITCTMTGKQRTIIKARATNAD